MARHTIVPMPAGARLYGLRLLSDGRQVLSSDQKLMQVLDFTRGGPAAASQATLNAVLRRLLEQVTHIRPGELGTYVLEVSLWEDPQSVVCHVPVSWDEVA